MREDFEGCIDGPRVFFRQVYITIVYTAFNLPARVHVYQFECLNTCKSLCWNMLYSVVIVAGVIQDDSELFLSLKLNLKTHTWPMMTSGFGAGWPGAALKRYTFETLAASRRHPLLQHLVIESSTYHQTFREINHRKCAKPLSSIYCILLFDLAAVRNFFRIDLQKLSMLCACFFFMWPWLKRRKLTKQNAYFGISYHF